MSSIMGCRDVTNMGTINGTGKEQVMLLFYSSDCATYLATAISLTTSIILFPHAIIVKPRIDLK